MKKIITFIIILLAFIYTDAQSSIIIEKGIKGGVTFSHINLDIPKVFSTTVNYGGHIAGFINIGRGDVTFQPEIQLIQKGSRVDDDMSDNYMNVRLNYIDIPLLVRANTGIGSTPIYFTFGPYIGVLLNDGYKIKKLSKYEIELRNGLLDAGIVFSGGVYIQNFLIELRACCGLVNVAEKTDDFYDDSRNNYVNVSVGYKFKK